MQESDGPRPFGAFLRQFRLAAGLSQEALAERARMSVEGVSALERGVRRVPHRETLALLVRALALEGPSRAAFEAAAARVPRTRTDGSGTPTAPQPALRTELARRARKGNLPLELTSFVARDAEVAEILGLLESSRLLTIVGAGGVGKTRIALRVAGSLTGIYPDGIWVVDLAPLSSPAFVAAAIGTTFDVGTKDASHSPMLLEATIRFLRAKRALIVLDNCEHVVVAVAEATEAILRQCPEIHMIATSRERIGIAGEYLYRLPSLAVPERSDGITAAAAMHYGAVELFVARARVALPSFALVDENAPLVAELCRRLDGIALALELAAPRVRIVNLEQLTKRVDDRFRLLTGGSRSALPRHRTMRAVIDWSYDALGRTERSLLRQLSVFRGGWTLDAASNVCIEKPCAEPEVLDLLAALVDKSLVIAETKSGQPRFRFFESTREYAFGKLVVAGEADAAARRHAGWCSAFAKRSDQTWDATPEIEWRGRIELELDNLRAALQWSLDDGHDPILGASLAGTLGEFWRCHRREGRLWLEKAAAALPPDAPPDVAARVALGQSWLLTVGSERHQAAARAVAAYRQLGDHRHLAIALLEFAHTIDQEPGWIKRAQAAADEALELAQREGFRRLVPSALAAGGGFKREQGAWDEARALLESALSMARDGQDTSGHSSALFRLSELEFEAGNIEAAQAYGEAALELDRERNVEVAVCADLSVLAAIALAADDLGAACRHAVAVLEVCGRAEQPAHRAIALEVLASVAASHGDAERAARLASFCNASFVALQHQRTHAERVAGERLQALLDAASGEDGFAKRAEDAAQMEPDAAVAEGLRVARAFTERTPDAAELDAIRA